MKYCTDLILGKAFCTFTFFHFPDSGLSVLNCFHFYFLWRDSEKGECGHFTVADPDLQIRGRPGHPDPEIRGGLVTKKTFFWPLGPQFGLKIREVGGSWAPPLDLPLLHYYRQFALSVGKESPLMFFKFSPLNMDTLLLRFSQKI